MTQFPSDDVPVRTKPSEAVMMMSSQSSHSSSGSYTSALSEQMDEDENLSIDSMKMEEHTEENDTLSKTLNNNDKNVKNAETAMEQDANESRDMFETSNNSVEAERTKEDANLQGSSPSKVSQVTEVLYEDVKHNS